MRSLARWMTGWRLPLRLARRDALQARARSVLVVVMIALPVLAVTAAVVAQRTIDVSTAEGLDRNLGAAQGLVSIDTANAAPMVQNADGSISQPVDAASSGTGLEPLSADALAAALGGARVLALAQIDVQIETDKGVATSQAYQVDLADPLTEGILELRSGRLPRAPDEVVVNRVVLGEGYAVGDPLRLVDEAATRPTIVGVAESTTVRDYPVVAGPVGSLPVGDSYTQQQYLVGGAPVSWTQVRRLNALGALVVSRAVVLDPPPASEIPDAVASASSGLDPTTLSVLALVVTMALLEVVLLAGPAFAVGARRLQRSLALMAAAGGTPAQARRVVLAGAWVLGVVAAAVGVLLGVAVAAAVLPLLQRVSGTYAGPFEVPVLPLLGVAGFGLVSALLAAVVPAWIASRQNVVAVLAGRRGDAAPSRTSSAIGTVLLGVGVGVAALGARQQGAELAIAFAALLSVLGMILLVPVVVVVVARLAGRLPLSLRYAARDAARHRTRTVPAVAAVAATVAGVVALLIANTSDGAQNEATYTPAFERGTGVVYVYAGMDPEQLSALQAIVGREVPGTSLSTTRGVPDNATIGAAGTYTYRSLSRTGGEQVPLLSQSGTAYGSSFLVSDGDLPPGMLGISATDAAVARRELSSGGVVAFTDEDPTAAPSAGSVVMTSTTADNQSGETVDEQATTLDATVVHVPTSGGTPAAVLSPAAAATLALPVGDVGLVLSGAPISKDQESAISEALAATGLDAGLSVERGYQAESETLIIQLILLGLGAVLMLGGTLTATFLALSDARPDLATLAAVGASPRRRRSVAAGYALVVGFVGALLGAVVGFVPGIAISYPLTTGVGSTSATIAGPFIDVPWLMVLGLVVVLPLLTAAIVALSARSRLPLVARLD